MEQNAPHPNAAFEGYYNKFSLPSGAHVVLVICKVSNVSSRGNAVTFTYVPQDATKIFQKELITDAISMQRLASGTRGFVLDIPGIGYARWAADSTTEYNLEHESFSFHATTKSRIPWSENTETPEGLLVYLPLPLHWHVQTLASPCNFKMHIPGYDQPSEDMIGEATVHQEKNWATSFPSAHMWVQCREGDRGFCCAGGQILGIEAFLLGYRSKDLNLDFRPPFALRMAGVGPFMSYKTNWKDRSFHLSVQSFRQRITVHAQAPKGSFFPLSSPFPEGHRDNFLGQSFAAKVEIKVYRSGWLSPWRLVREDFFDGASLEFGGGYYPPAGTSERFN